jgi:hypothetical protein
MRTRVAALAVVFLAVNIAAAAALIGSGSVRGAGSAPVTETNLDASGAIRVHEQGTAESRVVNLPLDAAGNLRTAGAATVQGTVAATQSGPWSVSLDPAPAADLGAIAGATSSLRYDADGNLRVTVGGGASAADPSEAGRSPFGFSHSTIPAETQVTLTAGSVARVTAYSFHSDHDVTAFFEEGDDLRFAIFVPAGQSMVGSFPHAIPADTLKLLCGGGSACYVLYSVAAY